MKEESPILLLPNEFDEQTAFEVESKGWYAQAVVRTDDGKRYGLFFYDPIRLAQDLEMDLSQGKNCIAEPGLVVIPKVTASNMRRAVHQLYLEGYFTRLVPLDG